MLTWPDKSGDFRENLGAPTHCMINKEEKARLKASFLRNLEFETSLHRNAHRKNLNWLQYRTGLKDIYLRLEIFQDQATLCFDFQHRNAEIRGLMFEQLSEMQNLLNSMSPQPWDREGEVPHPVTGLPIARISHTPQGLSIYNEADHPAIIRELTSFYRAFDKFWFDAKDVFTFLSK